MSNVITVFDFEYVDRDPEGYYITKWDRATPARIIGESQDDAMSKLRAIIGDPPGRREWTVRLLGISQRMGREDVADDAGI